MGSTGRRDGLPPAASAPLAELRPLPRAFPSWFLRIECDRCGKTTMLNEAHTGQRRARMRHDGCGGGAGKVELLTGVDGVSSRPVRRIVLRAG